MLQPLTCQWLHNAVLPQKPVCETATGIMYLNPCLAACSGAGPTKPGTCPFGSGVDTAPAAAPIPNASPSPSPSPSTKPSPQASPSRSPVPTPSPSSSPARSPSPSPSTSSSPARSPLASPKPSPVYMPPSSGGSRSPSPSPAKPYEPGRGNRRGRGGRDRQPSSAYFTPVASPSPSPSPSPKGCICPLVFIPGMCVWLSWMLLAALLHLPRRTNTHVITPAPQCVASMV
jgi:hypothetical protein